jgi:hypothetical protein
MWQQHEWPQLMDVPCWHALTHFSYTVSGCFVSDGLGRVAEHFKLLLLLLLLLLLQKRLCFLLASAVPAKLLGLNPAA